MGELYIPWTFQSFNWPWPEIIRKMCVFTKLGTCGRIDVNIQDRSGA